MMKTPLLTAILLHLVPTLLNAEEGFTPLFDGKTLSGWHSAKNSKDGNHGDFTVSQKEKAIHVYAKAETGKKQDIDVLYTDKDYSDYILKLEYRWGDKRFPPRADWDRDAGVLFHMTNEITKVWPNSVEMQIGESPGSKTTKGRYHAGDLFVIGKPIRAQAPRQGNFYKKDAPLVDIGKDKSFGHCFTKSGTEKPHGEWNQIEIRVEKNKKATFFLNGEQVLEVTNMEKQQGEKYIPLTTGRIGLQAEFAEIYYRNIRIKDLAKKK